MSQQDVGRLAYAKPWPTSNCCHGGAGVDAAAETGSRAGAGTGAAAGTETGSRAGASAGAETGAGASVGAGAGTGASVGTGEGTGASVGAGEGSARVHQLRGCTRSFWSDARWLQAVPATLRYASRTTPILSHRMCEYHS